MSLRRLLLVVPLLLTVASSAAAFDIGGTWTGTRKCTFFAVGVKSKVVREGSVVIAQSGNSVAFDSAIGSSHLYTGVANFGTEKAEKGELSLRHCRDHDDLDVPPFDALGRFTVKTKEGKVKATITGLTIVADDTADAPSVGTCKWKLARTSTSAPPVSKCLEAP